MDEQSTPDPNLSANPNPIPMPAPSRLASPVVNPPQGAPIPSKKQMLGLPIPIGLILLIAVIGVAVVVSNIRQQQQNKQENKNSPTAASNIAPPRAAEQVYVSPVDGTKTTLKEATYYALTAGYSEYYGHVTKLDADYIRVLPTAYKKAGVLTFTSSELQAPETATYFVVAAISKLQTLTDPAIIDALQAAKVTTADAFPSTDIDRYLKIGQLQAYYFADGSAFFAKTSSLKGTFLARASHVYVLQSSAAPTASGNTTQVSLALAKPDQYNTRTASTLSYWQNMKDSGQIVKAVSQYERQNP